MHYLHIFNSCTVTDLNTGFKITYKTKDYAIKLALIKPFPNTLYRLLIRNKSDLETALKCDCFPTAENNNLVCLCGYLDNKPVLKIVIYKEFSF